MYTLTLSFGSNRWWSQPGDCRPLFRLPAVNLARPKQVASDVQPGWFWRTAEGQRLMCTLADRAGPDPLDDPELGYQREED
jgi:hypothetical protein